MTDTEASVVAFGDLLSWFFGDLWSRQVRVLPVHEPPVEVPVKKSGRENGSEAGNNMGESCSGLAGCWDLGSVDVLRILFYAFWSACIFIRRLGRMIGWSWIQILCDLPGHKYCAEPARLVAFANAVLCNQRFKDEVLTSARCGWGWCFFFATQWRWWVMVWFKRNFTAKA